MIKPKIGPILIIIGSVLLLAPFLIQLSSVEYVQIQTSSPVVEGEVCSIDARIKTGVGVSGTANLFIDEIFYQSIGGSAGSDGIMYFSTGWRAVGVGNHVLRVCYFEDGYPTQPFDASTVITVTASGVPPPSNGEPPFIDEPDPEPVPDDTPTPIGSYVAFLGLGTIAIGAVVTAVEAKKLKLPH